MKVLPFVSALALLCLTGCVTLSQSDRYTLAEHHVSPRLYQMMLRHEPLPLDGIIELTKRQLSSRFIINYLTYTEAVYRLTPEEAALLREAKVSREVIDYLYNTPYMFVRPYVYERPYYRDDAYYPVYPAVGLQTVIVTRPYGRRCR